MPEKGALLALLIVERPLCVDCIAERSTLAVADVQSLITRIGRTIAINRAMDRCRACGRTEQVYSAFRSE
jgi:hypothetical protein